MDITYLLPHSHVFGYGCKTTLSSVIPTKVGIQETIQIPVVNCLVGATLRNPL